MRVKIPIETLFPKINTLRFRISVWYVALIGIVLGLFQLALYFNYVNSISREFDAQLEMKAEQIGGAVNTFRSMLGGQPQALTLASQQALNLGIEYPRYAFMPESPEKFWLADAKKLGLDRDYLVVMDSMGNVITQSSNVTPGLFLFFKKTGGLKLNKNMFYTLRVDKDILRAVVIPYYYSYTQGYVIAVGSSYAPVEWVLRKHLFYILGCSLAFLLIASLTVRIFVIRVLTSVLEISKVARNISQENLNARIILTHADAEIEHLTGSLNDMIARLEKSFSLIKEFSLEMAHEVKTPLAIISGQSQLALKKDLSVEEYKEIFGAVFKEAKRTQKFVSDLLLLTKLDYRLIRLKFEAIDLGVFLPEICEKMRFISDAQQVTITQEIPHGAVRVNGDENSLRRVFFNLIDNALKYTKPEGRIAIQLKRCGQKAVVLVSDNGCGISGEETSKVFNKFYRDMKNGPEADSGCGLGLSIASSIIKLHGGRIIIQSELGQGTTFTIEFPLIEN